MVFLRLIQHRWWLIVILAMALTFGAASQARALTGSSFNATDGNLTVQGTEKDWASIGIDCTSTPKVGCAIDLPTGQNDDSFGQGTKEDTPVPSVVSGSIPNNKSDLLRFYIANEKANGKDFLYLAWERVQEPNGTTNMDFEFNQSNVLSSNGVTPVRTAGDVLIKYDLAQGGTVPVLGYHRWITSGSSNDCEASNSLPCWDKVKPLAGINFEGSINAVAVTDPINPDAPRTLSPRTFGEAAINLTDSGIFPAGQCVNFGSAYLKSRSSDSFTSAVKDFIAPIGVNVSNCGKIIIRKETNPDGAPGSFSFTHNIPSDPSVPSPFSLSDNGSRTFSNVQSGTYTVTESDPTPGFDFVNIVCSVSTGGSSTTVVNGRSVAITLAPEETVDCTYNNRQRGNLVVKKLTDPSSDTTTSFSFTAGGGLSPSNFSLKNNETRTFSNVEPKSGYSLAETVPTGWELTSATCDNNNNDLSNITIGPGQTVTCTFNNRARGTLNIQKRDDAGNVLQGAVFELYVDNTPQGGTRGNEDTATGKTCTTASNGNCAISDIVPGRYWVVEKTGVSGYDLAPDQNVTVAAGSTQTLTFIDPRQFKVIVIVCRKADSTLYASKVSFDGAGLPGSPNSLGNGASLPGGVTEAALCSLGGATHDNVPKGAHSASIDIPQ